MKDAHAYARKPIEELYRWFADETAPTSPTWAALCRWIADAPSVVARLDSLPGAKRQPNMFLAALRFHDGPLAGGPDFVTWLDAHWPDVERTIRTRATQTNEPGRCAVLAPLLAALPQPVALFEVGASAGLLLLPDRYRYRYDAGEVVVGSAATPGAPLLDCATSGAPPGSPADVRVVRRDGLDAHPLTAGDPDQARWLRSLIWPGEDAREARLAAALAVAASDPPPVRVGHLPGDLPAFLSRARVTAEELGATPVLLHSATLAYLTRADREAVQAEILAAGVRWVSLEGAKVVPALYGRVADDGRPHFVLGLDGKPVARCGPHGGWVDWL